MNQGAFGFPVGMAPIPEGIKTITASGDFIVPDGVDFVTAFLVGAGGCGISASGISHDGGETSIRYAGETTTAPGGSGATTYVCGAGGIPGSNADLCIAGESGGVAPAPGGGSALGLGFGGSIDGASVNGGKYGGGGSGSVATYMGGGGGSVSIKRIAISSGNRLIKCIVGLGGSGTSGGGNGADGVIIILYSATKGYP